MQVAKKYRGNLEHVALQMIRDKLSAGEKIDLSKLLIAHYDADAIMDKACKEIAACQPFEKILVNQAGCSVSVHCGPGTFGIIYLAEPEDA